MKVLKPVKTKPNCSCPNCISSVYLYDDLQHCRACKTKLDWSEMFSKEEIERAIKFNNK